MTEEPIFIDSSIFLAFFMENRDFIEKLKGDLKTSVNVIEEVAYILIKEVAKEVTGIEKHYELLNYLKENDKIVKRISKEVFKDICSLLEHYRVDVLSPAPFILMFEISEEYGLLPNDALIAATCKYYSIKKIATFDDDFRRVDFLEVIDLKDGGKEKL